MKYINRLIGIESVLQNNTVILLGPRQTGKSTYIREELAAVVSRTYSLLQSDVYLQLSQDPSQLRKQLVAENLRDCVVAIDEIQKIPELLDEVQWLMEERRIRFLLTGSSARKLKRSGVNLLGGRGRDRQMHPLSYAELKDEFSLEQALNRGLIPSHYFADDADDALRAYIGRYLTEEIRDEGWVRKIPPFARFLEVAAAHNASLLNYTAIAQDAQIPRQTIQTYFQILYDTLLAFEVMPFTQSRKRKPIMTPKFYFFDVGIVRALRKIASISPGSQDYGMAFEHFIFHEIKTYCAYRRPGTEVKYWRSASGFEVDFIVGDRLAIECKASSRVHVGDLKGLNALKEEGLGLKSLVVSTQGHKTMEGDVTIYPWQQFLDELWRGELF